MSQPSTSQEHAEKAPPRPQQPRKHRRRSRYETLRLALVVALAIFVGVGLFAFGYGRGHVYFGDDPQACAQCHIMQDHYDSWLTSSHARVAVCNDCHLPHDSEINRWYTKAENGFFHAFAFTTDIFHEPIQIRERNRRITQNACLHCHGDFLHGLVQRDLTTMMCVDCHSDVGHRHRR